MESIEKKRLALETLNCKISELLTERDTLIDDIAYLERYRYIPELPALSADADSEFWQMTEFMNVIVLPFKDCPQDDPSGLNFNLFHSLEDAQLFAAKARETAALIHCKWYLDRDKGVPFVPDWNDADQEKWYVFWSHGEASYKVDVWYRDEHQGVVFSTKRKASCAALWMNEHKRLFGH